MNISVSPQTSNNFVPLLSKLEEHTMNEILKIIPDDSRRSFKEGLKSFLKQCTSSRALFACTPLLLQLNVDEFTYSVEPDVFLSEWTEMMKEKLVYMRENWKETKAILSHAPDLTGTVALKN